MAGQCFGTYAMTNDQMPSFAMFCMMHGSISFGSALIDTIDPGDEFFFKNIFQQVETLHKPVDGMTGSMKKDTLFSLIGLQDIQTAARKIFHDLDGPGIPGSVFARMHEKLAPDGILVFGYSGRTIREKIQGQIPFQKPLQQAGFSEITCFYAIPSHKEIKHVCSSKNRATAYYMKYLYPGTGSRYKQFLRSCLQHSGLITILLPACLIAARY